LISAGTKPGEFLFQKKNVFGKLAPVLSPNSSTGLTFIITCELRKGKAQTETVHLQPAVTANHQDVPVF